jgi:F0F1-type ATP synthase membrane subunit b/b'
MRSSRRGFSAFSLSFLDIMACGLGAVVLLFLILKHNTDVKDVMPTYDLNQEIEMLDGDIGEARDKTANAKSQASTLDAELATAQGEAQRIRKQLVAAKASGESIAVSVSDQEIDKLKSDVKRLEQQKKAVKAQLNAQSKQIRTFTGEGNREYLTGLKLGGRRILILLDASASMLDDTIVNIIRRRNMDDTAKRRSWKWQQALATIDWISARFPQDSQYQIFTFNTGVAPVLPETKWKWLRVSDFDQLNRAIDEMKRVIPGGGSSLAKALAAVNRLSPKPDNIYLITDGLPTQGLAPPRGTTVTGRQRVGLFEDAMTQLPRGIPINTILLPMEGDPLAAWAYWQVALQTRGAFLTPAKDWP